MQIPATVTAASPNYVIAELVHSTVAREGVAGARALVEEAETPELAVLFMGRMGMGTLRMVGDEMGVSDAEVLGRIPLVRAIVATRR